MLQIAVCDDSIADQERICQAVRDTYPETQICTFTSPGALLKKIEQNWLPTVALLDIQMEDMDGDRKKSFMVKPGITGYAQAYFRISIT